MCVVRGLKIGDVAILPGAFSDRLVFLHRLSWRAIATPLHNAVPRRRKSAIYFWTNRRWDWIKKWLNRLTKLITTPNFYGVDKTVDIFLAGAECDSRDTSRLQSLSKGAVFYHVDGCVGCSYLWMYCICVQVCFLVFLMVCKWDEFCWVQNERGLSRINCAEGWHLLFFLYGWHVINIKWNINQNTKKNKTC